MVLYDFFEVFFKFKIKGIVMNKLTIKHKASFKKPKERINWGLLIVIFLFVLCLKMQINLDLAGVFYPNVLHRCVDITPFSMKCF